MSLRMINEVEGFTSNPFKDLRVGRPPHDTESGLQKEEHNGRFVQYVYAICLGLSRRMDGQNSSRQLIGFEVVGALTKGNNGSWGPLQLPPLSTSGHVCVCILDAFISKPKAIIGYE